MNEICKRCKWPRHCRFTGECWGRERNDCAPGGLQHLCSPVAKCTSRPVSERRRSPDPGADSSDGKTAQELKPCPFCGEAAPTLETVHDSNYNLTSYYYECSQFIDCAARGPSRDTSEEAQKAWNERQG